MAWMGVKTAERTYVCGSFPWQGILKWGGGQQHSLQHISDWKMSRYLSRVWDYNCVKAGVGLTANLLQHYPSLNSWNYIVSVLTSSCKNISTSAFLKLWLFTLVETCPSVVGSGTAPQSVQQEFSLPCNHLSSHWQWIFLFVECTGDIRASCSLPSMQPRTWSDKVLCTGKPLPPLHLPTHTL